MFDVAARKLQNVHFLKLALKTLTLSFLREPNTHSEGKYTKYEGIGKISCFDIQSLNMKRCNFDTLPLGGIIGLDQSKQSSRAAMATLCHVGHACYRLLSLDTRESPVRSEELGCTSCCFGTESEKTISVKHRSQSWREVWTHLLSEKGTVVSCGPFAILYHARSPRIKRCFYT